MNIYIILLNELKQNSAMQEDSYDSVKEKHCFFKGIKFKGLTYSVIDGMPKSEKYILVGSMLWNR